MKPSFGFRPPRCFCIPPERASGHLEEPQVLPQQRPTSQPLLNNQPVAVRLLVGGNLPVEYTRAGKVAKRQPDPMLPGDIAYVKLRYDGLARLYPFAMAGDGYEFVTDAIEGEHYEFV